MDNLELMEKEYEMEKVHSQVISIPANGMGWWNIHIETQKAIINLLVDVS